MIRSIALVSVGTLASRLLGFARDALLAALLGAGVVADAFLIAFQLVTVVRRLLTEGAFNAAFVPAWLRVRTQDGDAAAFAFAGRALGNVTLIVVAAAVLLGLAMPWATSIAAPTLSDTPAVDLARWMLPYLAFAGPVAVLMALANAQHRVGLSAFAPLLFNAALIAVILVLLTMKVDSSRAATIVAAAVGLVGVLQLAMFLLTGGTQPRPRLGSDPPIRRLLAHAVPGMIANAGPQMLIVVGAIVASRAPSAVSWLYFASRLVDLPLGIIGNVAGAVLLPQLTQAVHAENAPAEAEARGVVLALALALPAAAGLFVLAEPIVRVMFERGAFTVNDSLATATALQALACGLPAQALFKALSPAFYAKHDPVTPMVATLVGLGVALGASLLLMPPLGVFGVALAIALGGWTSTAWLIAKRDNYVSSAVGPSLRVLVAAAAMGVIVMLISTQWPAATHLAAALRLAGLIACGVVSYAIGLVLTGAVRGLRGPASHGKGTPGDGLES